MITYGKHDSNKFILKTFFKDNIEKKINYIIKKENVITEFISKKEAIIFLPNKKKFNFEKMENVSKILSSLNRFFQLDINLLITPTLNKQQIIQSLIQNYEFKNGDVFSLKTKKENKIYDLKLINLSNEEIEFFNQTMEIEKIKTWVKNLQLTPPNIQTSENLSVILEKKFTENKINIKILNKKEIENLNMNLILAVNAGSNFEPRVAVIEYKGNPESEENTVLVGKGIIFDSGGYNLKPGQYMQHMKYDMSGAAIVAGTMLGIAKLKLKTNFSAVIPLTDNKISQKATVSDSIIKSMSGKSVEINNTDAEGRLILADALTYAKDVLKATRLIDVATLTGAVVVALGNTYTGVWTSLDKEWKQIKKAAQKANELVWRLPLHNDFAKFILKSEIADLKNTDLTGKGGSSSAAMFLKQFTDNVKHIHFDIAGTSNIKEMAKTPIVKTLIEFAKMIEKK